MFIKFFDNDHENQYYSKNDSNAKIYLQSLEALFSLISVTTI